ncbi:hypothetical protein [Mucilaginibacter paludis]|uniref:hypothetical protein n=1 Tax=Mucilaginibacter paludis TaxID=423351 RepID=UPI0003087E1F|nr:hypothetical protein [Mucilaginibacter paludis]
MSIPPGILWAELIDGLPTCISVAFSDVNFVPAISRFITKNRGICNQTSRH